MQNLLIPAPNYFCKKQLVRDTLDKDYFLQDHVEVGKCILLRSCLGHLFGLRYCALRWAKDALGMDLELFENGVLFET